MSAQHRRDPDNFHVIRDYAYANPLDYCYPDDMPNDPDDEPGPRYILQSHSRGRAWCIFDTHERMPIYFDPSPVGPPEDHLIIWHDEDQAQQVCDKLNEKTNNDA